MKEAAVLQPVLFRTNRTVSGCRDNHRNSSKPRNPRQKTLQPWSLKTEPWGGGVFELSASTDDGSIGASGSAPTGAPAESDELSDASSECSVEPSFDEEEARQKAEEAWRTVSADPFAAASAGSGSGATVPAPTGSPVAPPSVLAGVVTSGGSSNFGGGAEKYLPPLLPLINHGR